MPALQPEIRQVNETQYITPLREGGSQAGPVGKLDMGSRFRWLTATRSTVLQCSKVHPGLSADPAMTLKNLHKLLS